MFHYRRKPSFGLGGWNRELTFRRWLYISLRMGAVVAIVFAVWWGIWSLFAQVPTAKALNLMLGKAFLPLPFTISRWWDCPAAFLWAMLLAFILTAKSMTKLRGGRPRRERPYALIYRSELIFGLVNGFIIGLVFGVGLGLVVGFIIGLIVVFFLGLDHGLAHGVGFGVGFGLGFGLAFGLASLGLAYGFGLGFVLGSVLGLVFRVGLLLKKNKKFFQFQLEKISSFLLADDK